MSSVFFTKILKILFSFADSLHLLANFKKLFIKTTVSLCVYMAHDEWQSDVKWIFSNEFGIRVTQNFFAHKGAMNIKRLTNTGLGLLKAYCMKEKFSSQWHSNN